MRILVFNWKDLAHPHAGGAEVYTDEITRRWAAAGHDVTLFCAAVPGRPEGEEVAGVTVIRRGSRLTVYGEAKRFYRRHGRGRFDLVIDEVNTRPFGCAAWVDDAAVAALIHQLCREIWFSEMALPVALAGRFVLEPVWLRRYRDVPVLTVSRSSRESLLQAGLCDVRLVPPGIRRRIRPPVPREHRPTVIFLGRLSGSKRPQHALRAHRLLLRTLPDAQLWFVGDGPLRRTIENRAHEGVSVLGRVDSATRDELLARAHALVVTSVREGWGLVVDEAAAMGTPTIGYDRPGLCDSIPAAQGVIVPARPEALADAMARRLPAWAAALPAAGWSGGATDWDIVAGEVLAAATSLTVEELLR